MNSWGVDSWVIPLAMVADSNGVLTQLFPDNAKPGVNPFAPYAAGQLIRRPNDGSLDSVQIQTDGTNGGVIELWDISGLDGGIDVSSPTTPTITNAQKDALKARGLAKLIYSQNFTGTSGATIPTTVKRLFARGLAARCIYGGAVTTQACTLNLAVVKGWIKTTGLGNP